MSHIILPVSQAPPINAGGKFKGLVQLSKAGLNVPPFFALNLESDNMPGELSEALKAFADNPVAVRSSAQNEDGQDQSFAGQYETILNVKPLAEKVWIAALKCKASADSDRVKAYQDSPNGSNDFSVVVQQMVEPIWAGVLFTIDPVRNMHDRMLLSAVQGQGEQLVSGMANSLDSIIPKWGSNKGKAMGMPEDNAWKPEWTQALFEGAKTMEERLGAPQDLEWAIDDQGKLWWLQCRPVTTTSPFHVNELDTQLGADSEAQDWFTLGNIGEMMPGAVSPLTARLFGGAIEAGLRDFAKRSGALPNNTPNPRYVQVFYGRLFFNLSSLYDFARHTALNQKENIERSIVGRTLSTPKVDRETKGFRRSLNFIRQVRYIQSAGSRLRRLEQSAQYWQPIWADNPERLLEQLAQGAKRMEQAFMHHFATSSQSGSYYAALLQVLEKRFPDQGTATGLANQLLTNIGTIESADPLARLGDLADEILQYPSFDQAFAQADLGEARIMLERYAPESVTHKFAAFMERHGHRGVREAEFLEPTWEEAPESLLGMLQQMVRSGGKADALTSKASKLPKLKAGESFLAKLSRGAVLKREKSKALAIRIIHRLRQGYRHLGNLAKQQGLLKEAEDIFFLLPEEHNLLFKQGLPVAKARVEGRRRAYNTAGRFQFPDLFQGRPFPKLPQLRKNCEEGQWLGVPVSPGKIKAQVRLVRTMQDATSLKPGEIMVSGFTDIGWTPYYTVVSALLTEMGSPLSHGAVVAREYGLPAVVGVSGIMDALSNGDLVELDAFNGTIVLVQKATAQEEPSDP